MAQSQGNRVKCKHVGDWSNREFFFELLISIRCISPFRHLFGGYMFVFGNWDTKNKTFNTFNIQTNILYILSLED